MITLQAGSEVERKGRTAVSFVAIGAIATYLVAVLLLWMVSLWWRLCISCAGWSIVVGTGGLLLTIRTYTGEPKRAAAIAEWHKAKSPSVSAEPIPPIAFTNVRPWHFYGFTLPAVGRECVAHDSLDDAVLVTFSELSVPLWLVWTPALIVLLLLLSRRLCRGWGLRNPRISGTAFPVVSDDGEP